jgi:hypothetical protein
VSNNLFKWWAFPLVVAGSFLLSVTWLLDGHRPEAARSSLVGFGFLLLFSLIGYRTFFRSGMRLYFYGMVCVPVALSFLAAILGFAGVL